jgi:D-3-phosphoglycerate dehydrogenase
LSAGYRVQLIHPTIRDIGVATLKEKAEIFFAPDGDERTLIRELNASRADALIVRVECATRNIMQGAPHLKIVAMHGVGTDMIDIEAATEAGVLVLNTPWANFKSTAEHTVALMLGVAKNVLRGHAATTAGEFLSFRNTHLPMELEGRCLLVIGLGRIGSEVARKCQAAFGMRVLAVDPLYDREAMAAKGVELVTFEEGLRQADFVTVHVPLKADTRKMMNDRAFAAMKKGAIFLNVARGPVMDQRALFEALKSGHLSGAGLDVFDPEPPDTADPLFSLPNVVLSPHYGGDTVTARDRCSQTIANSVLAALAGQPVDGIVNPSVLNAANYRLRT